MWIQTCAVKHFENSTSSYFAKQLLALSKPTQRNPSTTWQVRGTFWNWATGQLWVLLSRALWMHQDDAQCVPGKRSSLVCTLGRWYLMKLHLCFLMLFISKDIAFWYNLFVISGTYSLPQASWENEAFMISLENEILPKSIHTDYKKRCKNPHV